MSRSAKQREVHFEVSAPECKEADVLYVTGTFNGWEPRDASTALSLDSSGIWKGTVRVPLRGHVEYKLTRGSWNTVEKREDGSEVPHRTLHARHGVVKVRVRGWSDQLEASSMDSPSPRVDRGDVRILENIWSPELKNKRDLLIYLPPSLSSRVNLKKAPHAFPETAPRLEKDSRKSQSKKPLPVIFMQDGQNLFDEEMSFAGEWRADETAEALAAEGLEMIIVGIPNMGDERLEEYCPWPSRRLGVKGRGDRYVRFMVETVKPRIEALLPKRPGIGPCFVAGSSAGALISLYAGLSRPDLFAGVGALSTAVSMARTRLFDFVRHTDSREVRVYLDTGTAENGPTNPRSKTTLENSRRLSRILRRAIDNFHFQVDEGAYHRESAWARRLPGALRFLLRD